MEVTWQKKDHMKNGQQNFNVDDLTNALGLGDLKSSVSNVGDTLVSTEQAMKAITPLANYVGNNWGKIVIGFFVGSLIINVVANMITKKL